MRDPRFTIPEFGDLCQTCEARYCLPSERATCTHHAICEDCWPNGCDECEMSTLEVPC